MHLMWEQMARFRVISLKKNSPSFSYVSMLLPIYMSVHCVHALPVKARKASDLLGLELQTVVCRHEGAGN